MSQIFRTFMADFSLEIMLLPVLFLRLNLSAGIGE